MFSRLFGGLMISTVLVLAFSGVGCNPAAKDNGKKDIPKGGPPEGWWCQEHGVPEEDCSLCLPEAEVKKRFKDTGDWCKIHERAQSQCFKCDPSKYKKFEDQHVAKMGKKPERPPEDEFKK